MRAAIPLALLLLLAAASAMAQSGASASDPFDRFLLHDRPATLLAAAAGDTALSTTVDRSAFPLIHVYTDILDEFGLPIPALDSSRLNVSQDGVPVEFQLRRMQDFGCPTAVCLVIDVSLSMQGAPIAAAREAAHDFVDRMGPYDRVAIVSFSNCVTVDAPFTGNRDSLHAAIDRLQPVGLTASFDGIYEAVRLTAAQPGYRAVIAFSDGCDNSSLSCFPPPDGWTDGYDDDSTLICGLAAGAAVAIHTLTFGPLESTCLDPMKAFAAGAGGQYRHSLDAEIIDSVYAALQESLCARYLIVYRSPDSLSNFDEHSITVCLSSAESPVCDTAIYVEPAAPEIALTDATIRLSETCQPSASDLAIEALIADPAAPGIQSVQLFYREAGAGDLPYAALPMSAAGTDLYRVVIPGAAWPPSALGIEYYIAASDGEATVTFPASSPHQDPLVISFCPNRPPDISGVVIDCGDSLTAIATAVIKDTLHSVAGAVAFYRRMGAAFYDSVAMYNVGSGLWAATLPGIVRKVNYELLIRARDDFGLAASAGPWPFRCDTIPDDNPHPTDRWIILRCDGPVFGSDTLRPDDTIRAWDPAGILCGKAVAGSDGAFGEMLVYADNPGTPLIDEGALPGDPITFTVNDFEILYSPGITWTQHLDTIDVCELLPCRLFSLDPGWHLISWDRTFSAPIDSFVARLGGDMCVDIILGFDEGAQAYDPALAQFSTLYAVDYRHAYWVRLECPAEFLLCGDLIAPTEYLPLTSGWNLVPYWPSDSLPTENAWSSILDVLDIGLGFDHGGLVWRPDDPLYNTLLDLAPGLGYWLRVRAADILSYPGWIAPPTRVLLPSELASSELSPSRQWLSLYGEHLTLDGVSLDDGAVITAASPDGSLCGIGTYRHNRLPFTAVYGADEDPRHAAYPSPGGQILLSVDNQPVFPALVWSSHADRLEINALSTSASAGTTVPASFALAQNYPNPFNPRTTIAFELPRAGRAVLSVYNILGQNIVTLLDSRLSAGRHTVKWDGRDRLNCEVGSGVYLYRLSFGDAVLQKKMLLLK